MSSLIEEREETWLRLCPSQHGDLLVHLGTGESHVLGDGYKLVFVDGSGVISKVGLDQAEGVVWACDKLRFSLVRRGGDKLVPGRLEIHDSQDESFTPWTDAMRRQSSTKVLELTVAGKLLALEVFVSEVPKGWFHSLWGMQRVITQLRGGAHDGRWLATNMKTVHDFFENLMYSRDHHRPSARSVREKLRSNSQLADEDVLAEYDTDLAISTDGAHHGVFACLD